MLAGVEIEALFWECEICTPTLPRIEIKKLCEKLHNNLMVMGGAIAAFRARNHSLYSLPHHTRHF
ncbi:hypothetical protein A4S05_09730 [Nostoc sp. KVJ20]|nr:hypothetical protein A4S05_09730 [Nostoc sp. KVJ20]